MVKYLLDICVVSELWKSHPAPQVLEWVNAHGETSCYLSVLTIGEVQKGIAKLTDAARKRTLEQWLERDLQARFAG